MSWTEITRREYRRDGLRYASDLTGGEWQLIAPHLPPARLLGRRRGTDLRAVTNAMLYLLTTGCQWRLLPRSSRLTRRCSGSSTAGATMAPGGRSTITCCRTPARRWVVRPARRPG